MLQRVLFPLCIGFVLLVGSYFAALYFFSLSRPSVVVETPTSTSTPIVTSTPETPIVTETPEEDTSPTTTPEKVEPETKVLHDVPFISQAPLGDWSDQRQQDGCEEASVLMAWKWVQGESLTKQEAVEEITSMSNWEENTYGSYRDTSAADTLARLFQEYYGYKRGRVEYDFSLQDVKRELQAGNILIVPFNGQILDNPNFKSPGPERHMLVVIGYDDATEEIITNDPGTRLGEGFRYSYHNFMASLRDYETGNHVPIAEERVAMIVVERVPSP